MNRDQLHQQISIELDSLQVVTQELSALLEDIVGRKPTLREVTAAGAFLAQFYNGIENILKRICVYEKVDLPSSDTWHVEMFQWFCAPSHPGLPVLFDDVLAEKLAPYRRFRHVVLHSYGFQLDWSRMVEGIRAVDEVFLLVKQRISEYMHLLDESDR